MVRQVDISSLLICSKHCENKSADCTYRGRLYVSYYEVYTKNCLTNYYTQPKMHNLFRVDVMKITALNNVVLPILFNVVNNIVQYC